MLEWDFVPFTWPTIVLLQQLDGGEQHGSVLRVCDIQFVQVLLLQQLKRVQILVTVKKEGGEMLLWGGEDERCTTE